MKTEKESKKAADKGDITRPKRVCAGDVCVNGAFTHQKIGSGAFSGKRISPDQGWIRHVSCRDFKVQAGTLAIYLKECALRMVITSRLKPNGRPTKVIVTIALAE